MKALARALINAAAYLELAEDRVDPDLATEALEEIALNLSYCTEEEKRVIEEVLADMRAAEVENGARTDMLDFLDTFMISFGLVDDADSLDSDDDNRINLL
jgi:hypothetical protein